MQEQIIKAAGRGRCQVDSGCYAFWMPKKKKEEPKKKKVNSLFCLTVELLNAERRGMFLTVAHLKHRDHYLFRLQGSRDERQPTCSSI